MMMDVIEEILARLPVKHVLRCKLLSKSCYNLIKTPRFIKKHLLRQQSHSSKLIVGKRKNLYDDDISWIVYTQPSSSSCERESQLSIPSSNLFTIIVGSCNGLLVFSSDAIWDNATSLTVCNPATRKYLSVPKPPLEHMLTSNHIKFDTKALGFAHDAKSDDYKLIKICNYDIYGTYSGLIQVWSMNTNSWKQINPSPTPLVISGYSPVCYGRLVNGIFYWFVRYEDSGGRDPTILSFDPTNDKFREIALPKEAARHCRYDTNVIDIMGSLSLPLCRSHASGFDYYDIWVMGSGSVWTKKFSTGHIPIGVRTTRNCTDGNFVMYQIFRWRPDSKEDCKIVLYDPHRNQVVAEALVKGLQNCSRVAWSLTDSLVTVPQTTTCSNENVGNKLLRPPLVGVFLGCVFTFFITYSLLA